MLTHVSDKLLWAVVLLGLGIVYFTVPQTLQQVKDAAKAPPPDCPPKSKKLQKDAEDKLQLDTLRNLADGYSFGLRNSAIKIIADRAVKGRTRELLLRDLASQDEDLRDNALNSIRLLIYSPALSDKHLQDHFVDQRTFDSLITALVNVLPLHGKPPQVDSKSIPEFLPSPIRPYKRPGHEVSLMIILTNLLHHHKRPSPFDNSYNSDTLGMALEAGIIERWLSHYPFPCALPENSKLNFKKSDVVSLFERKNWASDDMLMYEIMCILTVSPRAMKQLREVGLKASSYTENMDGGGWETRSWGGQDWSDQDNDVSMLGGEATAGIPIENWQPFEIVGLSDAPHPRSVERSREEESLRRRRREAVVVADRGAPFGRENILQRENSRAAPTPMSATENSDPDSMPDLVNLPGDANVQVVDIVGAQPEMDQEAQLAQLRREVDHEMEIEEIQEILQQTNYNPEQSVAMSDDISPIREQVDENERQMDGAT